MNVFQLLSHSNIHQAIFTSHGYPLTLSTLLDSYKQRLHNRVRLSNHPTHWLHFRNFEKFVQKHVGKPIIFKFQICLVNQTPKTFGHTLNNKNMTIYCRVAPLDSDGFVHYDSNEKVAVIAVI